jgi:hypothetical protein
MPSSGRKQEEKVIMMDRFNRKDKLDLGKKVLEDAWLLFHEISSNNEPIETNTIK